MGVFSPLHVDSSLVAETVATLAHRSASTGFIDVVEAPSYMKGWQCHRICLLDLECLLAPQADHNHICAELPVYSAQKVKDLFYARQFSCIFSFACAKSFSSVLCTVM